jgi:hypothetical protein
LEGGGGRMKGKCGEKEGYLEKKESNSPSKKSMPLSTLFNSCKLLNCLTLSSFKTRKNGCI